ncbi:MAG: sigma-54-dependent Fis family transcriptional regulator [Rhizobiaceae bacterium]|nr:sigma-54-dependent Fis family transcriptional regulator [Rhizobiaceae bacterium]
MAVSILIVDDDPVQRRLIESALGRFGYDTIVADGGEAGLAALEGPRGGDVSAVVLDLIMPGLDGLSVLREMRARGMETPVIVQTAQGGIDTVVSAMRHGAFDFVVKPASPERLQAAIANALKVNAAEGEVRRSARRIAAQPTFLDILASSPSLERVVRLGRKAAASNIPILIEGESGVGKELVARAIQAASDRRSRAFVTVNCGAIPETLVESVLFGHEKGAFTGATEKRPGKFAEAHGGTLFLDEIGDLPLDVQVKLLRAVQDGDIDTVGGRSTRVDIRLISATHRDLIQRVKDGLFREDLFYRLNVFPIHVPALRQRRADIPHLVQHFIAGNPLRYSGGAVDIGAKAMELLLAYDWPGNIRQLENAVLRALVLCDGDTLTEEDFPQIRAQVEGFVDLGAVEVSAPSLAPDELEGGVDLDAVVSEALGQGGAPRLPGGAVPALDGHGHVRSLADIEAAMIRLAIGRYNGQMSEVARRLGIGRSTLYRKLKEYGIDVIHDRVDVKDSALKV